MGLMGCAMKLNDEQRGWLFAAARGEPLPADARRWLIDHKYLRVGYGLTGLGLCNLIRNGWQGALPTITRPVTIRGRRYADNQSGLAD